MYQKGNFTENSMKKRIFVLVMFSLSAIDLCQALNCSSDPCMYGICLEDMNSTYSCYCIDGYTGINCEINWDDCWSNPCLNGGTCNDAVAAYNCTCAEGFVGMNCEQSYSQCLNHPCLNNGTCLDYDGVICQCPDGYSGDYCEIDASVCNDTICKNGGECMEGPGFSFFCRCPEGWTGRLCDEDVDECITSPCKNGGLCINTPASYTCACLFGYTGKDCDKTIVLCEENPCRNDAICLFEDERPVCYCVPDYHGILCELKYDDCESKFANCENGGTCIDGVNSFTCVCPTSYSGPFCNMHDLPSTSLPTFNETLDIDSDTEISVATSFMPKSSTLQEPDISSLMSTSTTIQTSTTVTNTSDVYTKWYPFIETTSSTLDINNINFFSSSSSSSSSSSTSTSSSSTSSASSTESSTEVTSFLNNTSSVYPIMSKETSESETVSPEPRTFSTDSSKISSVPSTTNIEMEYLTQKSLHNESDTTVGKTTYQDNVRTFVSINDTLPYETSTTSEYTSSTRYYPEVITSVEKIGEDTTTKNERDNDYSTAASSSIFMEFWRNKSTETTISMVEVPKTTSPFFTDKWTPSQITKSLNSENATFWSTNGTFLSVTSTSARSIFEEDTTINTELTTEKTLTTSKNTTECHGILCTSSAIPSTQNDSDCNCLRRENCKNSASITEAAFNGKSYARQQVAAETFTDTNTTLRIFMRLKTRFKDGIILHVYFDNEKYALVYLEYGSIKFQFSCGLETMLLGEIDSLIDNGYETDIETKFQYFIKNETNKCSARLLVNGTTAVSGEQTLPLDGSLPRYANLHLGGIPIVFSHHFAHVSMGFTGCMSSLKINGVSRHFIHDSVETFQIEDCASFLCLSNPCQNFGACEEVNGAVRCTCVRGYTGSFCERSSCDENPCAMGATCISSPGTGFICVCPLGTHGLLCEEDTVITRPSFSVLVPGFSSYVAYGISNSIKDTMELKMKLIPRSYEQISLIAYLGQSGTRRDLSDHLSITYVRGYIMLTWDLGAGVRRIFTSVPLSTITTASTAGKSYVAYTIQVGRRGQHAWLAVDGIGNVTGQVIGPMTQLDVSPILYIGGHKSRNFDLLPHDLPLHTGFSGCIFDIELRTDTAIYPITSSSPATGRGVGECHRNECIRHSCKNGAVCLNHAATYSCICTKEWMGSDCSIPIEALSAVDSSSC